MNEWMQTAFADHLDLARCSALIPEEDLAAGVVALGGSLALLQRDLLKLLWAEEMEGEQRLAALKATGRCRNGLSREI